MTIPELYSIYTEYASVETDTRKIKQGDIFFALKGPNFNGNLFTAKAFEAGAAYCVCDEKYSDNDPRIIYTENVLTTLQALAKYHRKQFTVPVIAITGSNGKTTTKELVNAVLSSAYRCHTTKGNLNNHIGIPLTLLAMKKDTEIAVIEMGANHLHEIEHYCTYTLPTHGLITNCGKAHLEGFGSEEGVRKGKGELYDYLAANNGTIFINNDYDYLQQMSNAVKNKISYGSNDADFTGEVNSHKGYLEVTVTKGADLPLLKTKLAGDYNLPNVMSAVCIGKTFHVPDEKIKASIEEYTPSNSRSQIISKDSNTILLDAYNANPSSMKAAIENFASMAGENKTVILGGMKELGKESIKEHEMIISLLQKYRWNKVVLAGEEYHDVPSGMLHFKTSAETADWFKQQNFSNELILIKGSRGMAMEKLLE